MSLWTRLFITFLFLGGNALFTSPTGPVNVKIPTVEAAQLHGAPRRVDMVDLFSNPNRAADPHRASVWVYPYPDGRLIEEQDLGRAIRDDTTNRWPQRLEFQEGDFLYLEAGALGYYPPIWDQYGGLIEATRIFSGPGFVWRTERSGYSTGTAFKNPELGKIRIRQWVGNTEPPPFGYPLGYPVPPDRFGCDVDNDYRDGSCYPRQPCYNCTPPPCYSNCGGSYPTPPPSYSPAGAFPISTFQVLWSRCIWDGSPGCLIRELDNQFNNGWGQTAGIDQPSGTWWQVPANTFIWTNTFGQGAKLPDGSWAPAGKLVPVRVNGTWGVYTSRQ